ncbi:CHAT domain-containing protein [Rudanella paleaurantiibacter]|uniref:CHAT domain-containing protein n=1 Tax=Rudanella paleaurantiibacter TaxID=2614655 RepID=A0A7J5TXX2_9BACT|nr:CHAT domain-containing tetratricopeptide repeat protein [Rudanella paleaurantiibacter]KAB7729964.1 CHAT domain-containing protein [Rudanella paleaurantiibacter]
MKGVWKPAIILVFLSGNTAGAQPAPKALDSLGALEYSVQKPLLHRLATTWPERVPKDSVYVRLLTDLARAYAQTGEASTAISWLQTLLRQAQANTLRLPAHSDALVKAYYRLAYVQQQQNRLADARETGRQGLRLAQQHPRSKWSSNLFSLLAYLWSTNGDYEQAATFARRGAAIGRVVGDPYAQANGYYEWAKACRSLDQTVLARQAIDSAIAVGRRYPAEVDLSLYYTVKASLCQRQRQYAQTEYWFGQAITLNRQLADTLGLASNYTDLGYFLGETGRYAEALRTLTLAVQLHPSSSGRAVALDNLGVLSGKMNRWAEAIGYFQRAIQMLVPAYHARRPDGCPTQTQIRSAPHKEFLLPILENMGFALSQQSGEAGLANALRTYQLADGLVHYMRWEHTGDGSKLYWRKKTHRLYERSIDVAYRRNDPAMVYYFMERSRAVLLTDQLNELGARQFLPTQLAQEGERLNQTVERLQQDLAQMPDRNPQYDRIQAQLLTQIDRRDSFLQRLAQTHPLYFSYRYNNTIRPLSEVVTWLGSRQQSLVSYFVGDAGVYILGVSSVGTRLVRQPLQPYTAVLDQWLSLLHHPAQLNSRMDAFVQAGTTLNQLLLAPLHLPPGRVVVAPDGPFVPFEALCRSARVPVDYLVNTYAFSYGYSVDRLLTESRNQIHPSSDGSFVGMAPVSFEAVPASQQQATLLGSAESLARIGSSFFMPTVLTGNAATRARFRQLAPSASVVQLFTHADADTLAREPVLYFADSVLRLSDLQGGAGFRTQLLVLSACNTGVGTYRKGEGVFSLARGFAALGVPSMVTSLLGGPSGSTYAITELFYTYLAEGMPRDLALQRAKQTWLRQASRSESLPNGWAGLILLGETGPLQLPNPLGVSMQNVGRVVAGTGLLAVGWWFGVRFRRRFKRPAQIHPPV